MRNRSRRSGMKNGIYEWNMHTGCETQNDGWLKYISRLCGGNSSRDTMRYFMTVCLIVNRVSASPLLTNPLPKSLLDYDNTFSSNWIVPSQPIYSLSQNDLGDGCSFKDGSVSCGSVDPIPALSSSSPPLEDTASQLSTPSQLNTPPMIQEATIAATNDKKCDYHEVRTYQLQMEIIDADSNSIAMESFIQAFAMKIYISNASMLWTRMEPRKSGITWK